MKWKLQTVVAQYIFKRIHYSIIHPTDEVKCWQSEAEQVDQRARSWPAWLSELTASRLVTREWQISPVITTKQLSPLVSSSEAPEVTWDGKIGWLIDWWVTTDALIRDNSWELLARVRRWCLLKFEKTCKIFQIELQIVLLDFLDGAGIEERYFLDILF